MKLKLVAAALLLSVNLPLARADAVLLLNTPFDGGLPGGEFIAVTSGNGIFTTFSLEYTSRIYTGFPYTYSLSKAVQGTGPNHANTPGYDTLSRGSAYLYTMLHFNQLGGYAATAALHKLNAGYLQEAFWALEDEWTFAAAGGAANPYLALAITQFGSFAGAQQDDAVGAVRVMNIATYPLLPDGLPGRQRQDQIVYVPDGGGTIALFGLALLGLAALRARLT